MNIILEILCVLCSYLLSPSANNSFPFYIPYKWCFKFWKISIFWKIFSRALVDIKLDIQLSWQYIKWCFQFGDHVPFVPCGSLLFFSFSCGSYLSFKFNYWCRFFFLDYNWSSGLKPIISYRSEISLKILIKRKLVCILSVNPEHKGPYLFALPLGHQHVDFFFLAKVRTRVSRFRRNIRWIPTKLIAKRFNIPTKKFKWYYVYVDSWDYIFIAQDFL